MEETSKFQIDKTKKERIIYQNQLLHYGLYMPEPEKCYWTDIPWHWHDEFEFGYIVGGSILYKTNHHEYTLRRGDGIFINSGTLHSLHRQEAAEEMALCSQFFDRSFLAGSSGSIYDLKYMMPVQERKRLDARPLYQGNPSDAVFLERLQEGIRLSQEKASFFELRVRSLFSELWETVYSWAMEGREEDSAFDSEEDERIKKMLSMIRENYSEKITASMLADAVHISERECYRVFRKILGITPGEFLVSIRLQKAQELLWNTDQSILEIALETGFGTGSYFCKIFKENHHITPNQYRRLKRK